MEFIASMKEKRSTPADREKNVFTMTIDEFERTNVRRIGYTVNEYMDGNKFVRPYYDRDCHLDTSTGKIDEEVFQRELESFQATIRTLHGDAEVAYAHRNGMKKLKGKPMDYISLRAYVKGFKMHVNEIGQLIKMKFPNGDHGMDLSVYKDRDQCLACINGHKSQDDTRFLIPITHQDEIRAFVAQHMYGDEQVISVQMPPKDAKKVKSRAIVKTARTDDRAVIQAAVDDVDVEAEVCRIDRPPLSWHQCEHALTSAGFVRPTRIRTKDDGFDFDADRSIPCAACGNRIHENYDFYVLQLFGSFFVVKSYSKNCKARYLNWENNLMTDIINIPENHQHYADFFAMVYQKRLVWTKAQRFMFFDGAKWSEVTQEEVLNIVSGTLSNLLKNIARYLIDLKLQIDLDLTKDAQTRKNESKKIGDKYQNIVSSFKFISREPTIRAVLNLSKNSLMSPFFEDNLDRNGWLLGFDNGVVDLKTCEFRPAKASDRISLSTGYNFISRDDPHFDQSIMDEVTAFIERIFPIEEEREMVQRYGGYCLLGVHPCKIFAVFTDDRDGNNGKSKFSLIQVCTLGSDYTKDGGSGNILYKSDKQENVNSHQGGMVAYDKKRLVVIEELSESKSLDNAMIKKLNGGGAEFEGRKAYGTTDIKFPWITKFILCCNNRKFPSFDFADLALLDRALIIYFRSRFCTNDEQYERYRHEPYTFRADDKDAEIRSIWRPYVMHWMLEGLRSWHVKGFREIPKVCREWKKSLVSSQDLVTPWIEDHLQKTGNNTDYVSRSELYSKFKDDVCEERNRKTKLGMAGFEKIASSILGTCLERPMIKVSETQSKQVRNVWLGWKLKPIL